MKRADKVLTLGEVDAGLAADRGVHLREQRRGYLDNVDPAHVDGGQETSDVAGDTSAERHDAGCAVGAGGVHPVGQTFNLRKPLVAFTGLEFEQGKVVAFEALFQPRSLMPPSLPVGNDEEPSAGRDGLEVRCRLLHAAAFDYHVVRGVSGVDRNPLHAPVVPCGPTLAVVLSTSAGVLIERSTRSANLPCTAAGAYRGATACREADASS